jgi:hypothetical protein
MNFDLDVITTNALVVVPIIVAITQSIKLTGWVQDHFAPLVAIGVGILISWIADNNNPDFSNVVFGGVIYGLISSGLYSQVKTTFIAHAKQKAEKERKHQAHQKSNRGDHK